MLGYVLGHRSWRQNSRPRGGNAAPACKGAVHGLEGSVCARLIGTVLDVSSGGTVAVLRCCTSRGYERASPSVQASALSAPLVLSSREAEADRVTQGRLSVVSCIGLARRLPAPAGFVCTRRFGRRRRACMITTPDLHRRGGWQCSSTLVGGQVGVRSCACLQVRAGRREGWRRFAAMCRSAPHPRRTVRLGRRATRCRISVKSCSRSTGAMAM
jgi:hypothetical protein